MDVIEHMTEALTEQIVRKKDEEILRHMEGIDLINEMEEKSLLELSENESVHINDMLSEVYDILSKDYADMNWDDAVIEEIHNRMLYMLQELAGKRRAKRVSMNLQQALDIIHGKGNYELECRRDGDKLTYALAVKNKVSKFDVNLDQEKFKIGG
ncbi:hypothetical protein FP74_gp224 [Bacillus phage CAM003]|uniref:Uncharacterized protein n=1 Tax=Bacillus phage CAM003 TaxID=1486657 RepID=A0A024AZM0_9CAUD|nr:hypothetical protein FP74_gp224 [Bacillus phage CAM003]AHZ09572.1 hypothetical protein [Bacillus phage CAM003]